MSRLWQKIKNVVYNRLFRDEVLRLQVDTRFLQQSGAPRSNEQPIHYVIRREGVGHGFFSNFLHVLMNVVIAERFGWVPVVDQQTKATLYHTNELGESNLWYRYFEGDWDISDLLERGERVIFSDEKFPYEIYWKLIGDRLYFSVEHSKYLQALCQRHIVPRRELVNEVDGFVAQSGTDFSRVIGVHWRRTDITSVGRKPATMDELRFAIDDLLDHGVADKIFLCSDQEQSVAQFKSVYGDRLLHADCYRSENEESIHLNLNAGIRTDHAYLCGKEVLIDALLLSRCKYIVGKTSNVIVAASILGGFQSENIIKIPE